MARIPNEEIERLKREVLVERMAAAFGIELRRHGADLLGRCPFHDDREPSLVISPEKNLWHCLGECQTGGSVMDWVMKTKGVSFRYAVELLKADHPSLAAPAEKIVRKDTTTKLDAPVSADAGDQEVLRQVVDYYHETLKASPEALRYLESRGLTHLEMASHFQLGFANRTLGYRLPEKNRKAGAEMRGRLQKLGSHWITGSTAYPAFSYSHNKLGQMISETYPSGRPTGVTNSTTGTAYASGATYAANGAVNSLPMGNGVTVSTTFNTRLQPAGIQAGSLMSLAYGYGTGNNNGNVRSQTTTWPGLSAIPQTYLYL